MNAVFALLLLAGSGLTRVPGIKVGHFTLAERVTELTADIDRDCSFNNRAKFADLLESSRAKVAG
ncbi:MAG TPA: hypothetical protein VJH87_22580, partial [Vicinamibacteria bacterium]|nr:hypothetical protein [Vicinamibacteria bacterium]